MYLNACYNRLAIELSEVQWTSVFLILWHLSYIKIYRISFSMLPPHLHAIFAMGVMFATINNDRLIQQIQAYVYSLSFNVIDVRYTLVKQTLSFYWILMYTVYILMQCNKMHIVYTSCAKRFYVFVFAIRYAPGTNEITLNEQRLYCFFFDVVQGSIDMVCRKY